jgi:hypothetical protein
VGAKRHCLVACAEKVLTYLGHTIDYARVAKLLRAGTDFTPFTHLRFLEQFGLSIIWGMHGDVSLYGLGGAARYPTS